MEDITKTIFNVLSWLLPALTGVIATWLSVRKIKSEKAKIDAEAKKTDTESDKIRMDTAAGYIDAANALIEPLKERLATMEAEAKHCLEKFADAKKENEELSQQVKILISKVSRLEQENGRLLDENIAKDAKIRVLESQAASQDTRIRELENEIAQLRRLKGEL